MAIGMLARLKIQEGKNAEFEKVFAEIQGKVREEPGNLHYTCYKTDDPTVYLVMEEYTDEDAVAAHSKHLGEVAGGLGAVMGGRPEVERYDSI